jgi:hypothetical protein
MNEPNSIQTLLKDIINQILLFLDNNQILTDENFYKRLYNNNIFFLNKINSAVEINKGGFYKIYNNIFDYKKIIFLIILLNKIFSNGL